MTQEDKQLLLADLCARLLYGVKIRLGENPEIITLTTIDMVNGSVAGSWAQPYPYLRPMSSMTEEEVKEFYDVECMDAKVGYIKPTWNWHFTINGIDWFNKNHFDYRGLIEKGLAIVVTEENNPYKE